MEVLLTIWLCLLSIQYASMLFRKYMDLFEKF